MEDSKIIDLFFDRNEDAIRETDQAYGKLCTRIAYNILNDMYDSEECKNDTYLSLWNKIPPKRPESFRAFLCKIARNLALKKLEYKQAQKRSSFCEISLSELDEVLPDDSFHAEIEVDELSRLLNEFIGMQKKENRIFFVKRYYFYESIAVIAKETASSESRVKSALFHMRSKLKFFLSEKGVLL